MLHSAFAHKAQIFLKKKKKKLSFGARTRTQSHNGVVIHADSMFFKRYSNYEKYSYFPPALPLQSKSHFQGKAGGKEHTE